MVPVLAGAQVVLSTRIDHKSIWAKVTGGRQGEASIRATKVEASIGTHSKDKERKDLQSMRDLGHQIRAIVGLLKETISIKLGKIKLYLDQEVILGVGVEWLAYAAISIHTLHKDAPFIRPTPTQAVTVVTCYILPRNASNQSLRFILVK